MNEKFVPSMTRNIKLHWLYMQSCQIWKICLQLGNHNANLNMRWRKTSKYLYQKNIYVFNDAIHVYSRLVSWNKQAVVPFLINFSCWKCANNGCMGTVVSLLIGLLYAILQLPLDNRENKNWGNVCRSQIRKNIFPRKFLLIQYFTGTPILAASVYELHCSKLIFCRNMNKPVSLVNMRTKLGNLYHIWVK